MTLRDRFFNVAKAELRYAARRLRTSAEHFAHEAGRVRRGEPVDPEAEAIREQIRREERQRERARRAGRPPPSATEASPDVRRYYANLELPLGASEAEVKAAYRRLMRRYHPDKHALDPARAKVAHELAQQLREAYEGLLDHLGSRSKA